VSHAKRFRRYLKPYLPRFAWACAAMLVVSAFNGLSILLMQPIVDKIFIHKDLPMLWLAVAGLPLLVILKSIASYAQNYLMSWIGQRVTQQIREDLFRHLHELPLEFYSGRKGADVLSRVTGDLTLVQAALTTLPVYLIRDTLTVGFLTLALFRLDWRFALLALLGSPLSLAALYFLSRKMRESGRQAQIAVDRLHHRFQESVQGMLVIKAYNDEPGTIERFQDENAAFFEPMMRYLRATALMTPLMEVGAAAIVAAILFFGGREVMLGHMTPGAFFAFLGGLVAAYAPIKNLARTNADLQRAWVSVERLFQLLGEKSALPKKRLPLFPGFAKSIRFDGVGFRYAGSRTWSLRGLDLDIAKGERLALVGPSGCGKSTLARLLLRLHDPAEGALRFDGADARGFDAASIRSRAGLVTSESSLFNDTVFSNVALGRQVTTLSEVERACRSAGAAEFIEALPEGYQTLLGDWGFSLSAGQRQKVALARLILRDPELVVLDEATAHLDGPAEKEIHATLDRILAGRTVVTIAHELRAVEGADRIAVMSAGAVVETGSHRELMGAGGLYRRLFDLEDASRPSGRKP
jgi:subfamily B ATP-binding cassette protein MsbA